MNTYTPVGESMSEKAREMSQGLNMITVYGQVLAELPLDEWLEALDQADAVGPIIDPTLYRKYPYSPKARQVRSLLRAAVTLRDAVKKHSEAPQSND